jgi:cyclopropane-fatty-acyl-phospholipid synthase
VAFSQTAPLRRALTTSLPRRPFGVRFWDGTEVTATEPGAPTLTLRAPQALAHALRAPGELGLGRAYVAGMIDVDDLDGALLMVDAFEPPDLSLGQKVSLWARPPATGPDRRAPAPRAAAHDFARSARSSPPLRRRQ